MELFSRSYNEQAITGDDDETMQGETRDSATSSSTGTTTHKQPVESTMNNNNDLLSMWETVSNNKNDRDKAFETTLAFVQNEMEELVTAGVDAFYRSERATSELNSFKNEFQNLQAELERMRVSDEKSRATLAVRLMNV